MGTAHSIWPIGAHSKAQGPLVPWHQHCPGKGASCPIKPVLSYLFPFLKPQVQHPNGTAPTPTLMGPSATPTAQLCFPAVRRLPVPLPGLLPSHMHTVAVITPNRATRAPGCVGPMFLTLRTPGFGKNKPVPSSTKSMFACRVYSDRRCVSWRQGCPTGHGEVQLPAVGRCSAQGRGDPPAGQHQRPRPRSTGLQVAPLSSSGLSPPSFSQRT